MKEFFKISAAALVAFYVYDKFLLPKGRVDYTDEPIAAGD
jgi:hypothetical protein